MALPRVLKLFNLFVDGFGFAGEVNEVQLPKISTKNEQHRGGGMLGDVSMDLGLDKLEIEHQYAGLVTDIVKQFGRPGLGSVGLRFCGAYEDTDTGFVHAVEVSLRGNHVDMDPGKAKAGDKTEFKFKTACTYYKMEMDGKTVMEIDLVNAIYIVDGVDLMAAHRAAIGGY